MNWTIEQLNCSPEQYAQLVLLNERLETIEFRLLEKEESTGGGFWRDIKENVVKDASNHVQKQLSSSTTQPGPPAVGKKDVKIARQLTRSVPPPLVQTKKESSASSGKVSELRLKYEKSKRVISGIMRISKQSPPPPRVMTLAKPSRNSKFNDY